MKEDNFCPYCDEMIKLDVTDDYYFVNQGDEVERIDCPKCSKPIVITWEMEHRINFREV